MQARENSSTFEPSAINDMCAKRNDPYYDDIGTRQFDTKYVWEIRLYMMC